jgi:threonine synthase
LTEERSLCRYQAALPVDPVHRISLGDGWTPLLPIDWKGQRIQVKPEWFNPTSSFKDRGVSVMISHLVGQGATHVLEDSSGGRARGRRLHLRAVPVDAARTRPHSDAHIHTSSPRRLPMRIWAISGCVTASDHDPGPGGDPGQHRMPVNAIGPAEPKLGRGPTDAASDRAGGCRDVS